ncbi:group II intron maturase-specific domain-containing protein [Nonomuraea sp. NPDC050733]|uniref:group II intron maturase-specific domain-containing protein n=1 Tax=Nonomuraea sp. NPDC050733 TaxID=3154633 RepID=UPI003403B9BF
MVRYADDMIALCHSQRQAQQVKAKLAEWLEPRGLVFNEDKTKIVHLSEGFDFLGVNIRRYSHGRLMTKPSTPAVRRLKLRLATEMRSLRGSNAKAVIARLDPIVRGWAAYYRSMVSSRVFAALDHYVWQLTFKWATHSHPNKPTYWVVDQHFGKFNKFRNDRWVFGDRDSGAYLPKFSWTNIVRHTLVRGGASPDDPAQAEYWAERRKRVKPPIDRYTLRLLTRQDARCPLCGDHLLTAEQPPQTPSQWERWWLHVARRAIASDYLVHHGRPGAPDGDQTRLVHASCHRGHLARQRRGPAPRI